MRLRSLFFLGVALTLTGASVAAADVSLHISLVYQKSYDATYSSYSVLPNVVVPGGNASLTQVNVPSGTPYVNHQFGIYATVTGLSADQDLTSLMFGRTVTGSVTAGTYTPNSYTVDPPSMGSPNSNAPGATWDFDNSFNGVSYLVDVISGTSTGAPDGNTFGDYAAYMQLGESGAFLLGTHILTANTLGTYGFSFSPNPGYLQIIGGNTNGAASDWQSQSFPTYTGIGDSALFTPRAPSDVTWANGTGSTSPTWAAGDGQGHWVQTGSPAVRDNFYHTDTVRFTGLATTGRTVTLVGNLNPASVIVDSSGNYTFTGSGAIVGTGTTLTKRGTGTLTIGNMGANTYTGLTSIEDGVLVLGASNVLPAGAVTLSGGTLSMGSNSDSVGLVTLSSGAIVGTGSAKLTSTAGFAVQSGTASAALGGSVGLTKTTSATVVLSGGNTYTGLTRVQQGTLQLASSGSVAGDVAVDSLATLQGEGSVGGNLTSAAASLVAPGVPVATIGTLTVGGDADVGGTLLIEHDALASQPIDVLAVGGALDLGGATIDFNQLGASLTAPVYVFATFASLISPAASEENVPTGYNVDYAYNGGTAAALVLIPEPTSLALLAMGLLGLIAYACRKRK
jgi:autotransporter-associated beta strand protein